MPFLVGLATTIWFTIGGVRDLRDFFRALRLLKRDASDDGRVAVSGEEAKRVFVVVEKPQQVAEKVEFLK